MSAGDDRPFDEQLVQSAPALARIAAGMGWRAAKWGTLASLRTGARLGRAAADPVFRVEVVQELGAGLRAYARDLLGIAELDERVGQLMPTGRGASDHGSGNGTAPGHLDLRFRGASLLAAAARVEPDEAAHPAYARILTELAPDEARILRLLATEGSQPAVDVRASGLLGVDAQLVGEGLNMIGAQAGCRHRDRVPAYLNNLERLGLIRFSDEPIEDPIAYQVLEAQPDVMTALGSATRAKTVQRSIHLNPFGEDFCRVCLPLDTAEMEALARDRE